MRLSVLLVLTISMSAWNRADGLRILGVFPLNGKSHWVMSERLMLGLAERGHHVDVVTHFTVKNPPKNYREIDMNGTLPLVMNNMTKENVERVRQQDMSYLVHIGGNRTCELLAHPKLQNLIKNPPREPYDVIIVELFVAPCFLPFGRHLRAPMVGLITTAFHEWLSDVTGNPHNPSYTPSIFAPFGQQMDFWERLMNTFLTNLISTQLNYYMDQQVDYVKKYFEIDAPIRDFYKDLTVILVNSHHSINGVKPMTTGVVEVGGLHVKETGDPLTPEVEKWLNESTHGCIFFTFGSMVRFETFPKPTLETFYKVFEKIAPVRVLMKIAKKEELPPGLPKNVMTQPWFPQVSVFKHKNTKAFITHGGLMSVQEAIYHEIPIVGIPLFGDQPMNLKNAVRKGIAIAFESIESVMEETLGNAINTILHNETYRSNMKVLSRLFKDRPMSALDTAIYYVEYAARNKFALQSPAVHLNWWQQNLFDIYGFVLACTAVAVYVAILILTALKNCLCGRKRRPRTKYSESKKRK